MEAPVSLPCLALWAVGLPAGYLVYKLVTPKAIGTIPHNRLAWLVGDIPAIAESVKTGMGITHWLSQQAFQHGPIMSVHMGPFVSKVVITDPQEVEDILTKRCEEFTFSDTQKIVFGGTMPYGMLSLPTDAMWQTHRRSLNPCMNTQYLKMCAPRVNEASRQLTGLWKEKMRRMPEGACMDIAEDIQLCTMDTISTFLFGEPFGSLSAALQALNDSSPHPDIPMHDAVRLLFDVMGAAASSPLPRVAYWWHKRQKEWKDAYSLFSDYVEKKISEAKVDFSSSQSSRQTTVLDIIYSREAYRGSFPEEELKDEMLNFLLAGQDTTAIALQWGLKFLSHHPQVQHTLRAHLVEKGILELEEVTFDDVRADNAPYLEAVVWEILRLAQVGLFISRMATRETQILGHIIPKGTEVVLHVGHVAVHDDEANAQRRRQFYHSDSKRPRTSGPWTEDGKLFLPERWLDQYGRFDPNHSVFPFGGGPRMCFGYRFALLQLKLILVELQRNFVFDAPLDPNMDLWKVKETVNRAPMQNYVVIRRYEGDKDEGGYTVDS